MTTQMRQYIRDDSHDDNDNENVDTVVTDVVADVIPSSSSSNIVVFPSSAVKLEEIEQHQTTTIAAHSSTLSQSSNSHRTTTNGTDNKEDGENSISTSSSSSSSKDDRRSRKEGHSSRQSDGNNSSNNISNKRPKTTTTDDSLGAYIVNPNENDVLCGRGSFVNYHTGNKQFRNIIESKTKDYFAASNTKGFKKKDVAASVVNTIRTMNPQGRFLEVDSNTGLWVDIGDTKAMLKIKQAFRDAPKTIRTSSIIDPIARPNDGGDENGIDHQDAAVAVGEKYCHRRKKDEESPPEQEQERSSKTRICNRQGQEHSGRKDNSATAAADNEDEVFDLLNSYNDGNGDGDGDGVDDDNNNKNMNAGTDANEMKEHSGTSGSELHGGVYDEQTAAELNKAKLLGEHLNKLLKTALREIQGILEIKEQYFDTTLSKQTLVIARNKKKITPKTIALAIDVQRQRKQFQDQLQEAQQFMHIHQQELTQKRQRENIGCGVSQNYTTSTDTSSAATRKVTEDDIDGTHSPIFVVKPVPAVRYPIQESGLIDLIAEPIENEQRKNQQVRTHRHLQLTNREELERKTKELMAIHTAQLGREYLEQLHLQELHLQQQQRQSLVTQIVRANQEVRVAAEAVEIELHPHDILLGRGGYNHPGNQWYRNLVRTNHALYRNVPGGTKPRVSKLIVEAVNQLVPPGRFLTLSSSLSSSTIWKVIPYEQAITKTSQALRDSSTSCIRATRGGRDVNGRSPPSLLGFENPIRAQSQLPVHSISSLLCNAQQQNGQQQDEEEIHNSIGMTSTNATITPISSDIGVRHRMNNEPIVPNQQKGDDIDISLLKIISQNTGDNGDDEDGGDGCDIDDDCSTDSDILIF